MDQLPVTLCLVHTVYVHVQVPLVYGGTQGFDRGELLKECLYFCMCFRESMLFELARKETEVTKATSAGSVSVSSHHTLALRTADPQPVTGVSGDESYMIGHQYGTRCPNRVRCMFG